MLSTLEKAENNTGNELGHVLEKKFECWQDVFSFSSNAMTHFSFGNTENNHGHADIHPAMPRWSMLASEVEELEKEIVVRMEAPGMEMADFKISIEKDMLTLSGEKHSQREMRDSTYHLMERAYGSFQRNILLPREVDASIAKVFYRGGVLNIRLPKLVHDKCSVK
jgi:HSP20 family protein